MGAELLIAPAIGFVVLVVWNYKLEDITKRKLRKYMDKEADKETSIFIDPR